MALIVHKYGGTSMGSTERIRNVAKRVAKWSRAGHQMVVVPSAMSGETNRLLGLAKELMPDARSPESLTRSPGINGTSGTRATSINDTRSAFSSFRLGATVSCEIRSSENASESSTRAASVCCPRCSTIGCLQVFSSDFSADSL